MEFLGGDSGRWGGRKFTLGEGECLLLLLLLLLLENEVVVEGVEEFDVELGESFNEILTFGGGDESEGGEVVVVAVGEEARDDWHVEAVDLVGWLGRGVLKQNCRAAFSILL